jgi:hypothetical protein
MAVSDKTRKSLWGRSGNQCAICRHKLVIDPTHEDKESVVGEECHIVSGRGQGPRFDPSFPEDRLDLPENLILLCRIDHKKVDDQSETFSVEALQTMKASHENWVSSTLTGKTTPPSIRVRRIRGNIPTWLVRMTSGQDIMTIVDDALAYAFEHDDPKSEAEVDLLGGFFQEIQDFGDILADLEAGERVKTRFRISTLLEELETEGFWVFGGQEIRRLEGGADSPSPFPVAVLKVLRSSNPEIIRVDPPDASRQGVSPEDGPANADNGKGS